MINSENQTGKAFVKYVLDHKLVFSLLLLLLVVFMWALIKTNSNKKHFEAEKKQLITAYDSAVISKMEQTSKVFSWAVRSEMLRNNLEQVNQFFLSFIKEPNILKVQLIDTKTSKVILSTDRKDEGTTVSDSTFLNTDATSYQKAIDGSNLTIISPVMGLNSKIGILIITTNKTSIK